MQQALTEAVDAAAPSEVTKSTPNSRPVLLPKRVNLWVNWFLLKGFLFCVGATVLIALANGEAGTYIAIWFLGPMYVGGVACVLWVMKRCDFGKEVTKHVKFRLKVINNSSSMFFYVATEIMNGNANGDNSPCYAENNCWRLYLGLGVSLILFVAMALALVCRGSVEKKENVPLVSRESFVFPYDSPSFVAYFWLECLAVGVQFVLAVSTFSHFTTNFPVFILWSFDYLIAAITWILDVDF